MQSPVTISLLLASISLSLIGCSSEADVRSHIGSGNEAPPRTVAEDESLFLEVRGDQFKLGDTSSGSESTNVFIEIAPDRMIHSKRYRVFWAGDAAQQIEYESLDRRKLSEEEYQSMRQRLSEYLRPIGSERNGPFTPTDCSVVLGGITQAIISIGQNFRSADSQFIFPSKCESASGVLIREDLNDIIDRLLPLEGVTGSRIK